LKKDNRAGEFQNFWNLGKVFYFFDVFEVHNGIGIQKVILYYNDSSQGL
jgi:hypothetical protein